MKTLFAALVAGLVAFVPMTASAHGPTRQKVIETVEINAPADKVWAAVSDWQDVSWNPAIEKVEGKNAEEIGATRTLTLKNGEVMEEGLEKFDPAKMMLFYRLEKDNIKALPVTNFSSRMTVKDLGNGKSSLTWWGAFYRGYPNNDPPPELSDEAAVSAVKKYFDDALAVLKTKLESGS